MAVNDDDVAPAGGLDALMPRFQGAYQDIYKKMQENAAAKQAAQQSYLSALQQQEGPLSQTGISDLDKAAMFAQAAGAFGAPTRSGGFTETLANVGTTLAGPLSKQAEIQRARAQQLQQLQMARQKLGMEMAGSGGVSPSDMMALLKAQQDQEEEKPTPSEFERVIGQLSPDERQKALRVKAGLETGSDEETYRNVVRPDGSTITILKKGNQTLDPMTRQPLDLSKIVEEQRASVDADRQSQALEYGVPLLPVDPYAALPQKDREKARLNRYQADTRVLQKQADEVPDSSLRSEVLDYKRFAALNQENQRTGPGWSLTPELTTSSQNMKEIEKRLTVAAGKDLKGAASDRDVAMFGQTVPSIGKNPEANANTIKFGIMKTATELERRAFLRDYLAVNKTLEGADRKWDEYRNANPFFIYPPNADITKLDPSTLQENKNRLSYGDYFRQQKGRGATPVTRNEQGQLVVGGE
tara:strand:+ start:8369 stop:9778 length:1410 start_codon:yes stop_codon:yes gene_type:complete